MVEKECECKRIGRIWNKGFLTDSDLEYLRHKVGEVFEPLNEYYNDLGQKVYVLQCSACKDIIHVPA